MVLFFSKETFKKEDIPASMYFDYKNVLYLLFINKHNNGSSTTKEIVSPVFHDLWGYPIPWTNAEWNDQKRKDLVQSTLKIKVSFFYT